MLTCTATNAVRRMCRSVALATTLLITSCTALDSINATPTPAPTATETPLPSPTIDWFPPSETPTREVFPTNPPTPEMRPGLGATILTDDFSTSTLWDIAASDEASAGIDSNSLLIAAQSGVYMTSLRHDLVLDDFYAEITARTSLCRGNDDYGILVRANGGTYYRFALSCNGKVHADRMNNGIRVTLQPAILSGDVPSAAPGEVRIGVWAVGREMRLFLNGHYQFSLREASFPRGTLGVFVNSAGETATIVSFSDLVIQNVDYVLPTPTSFP
ncbi:MAG: hypothetical protein HZB50_12615 [Chloroflexi bacterium]|nr:hypothetical protein [Chloroflexota bacterium]